MIEIRGLSKRFGSQHVLENVDLDIPTGQSLVILGRSGAGKSVLLKLIIGLLKPDSGGVRVDGQEVGVLSYRELTDLRRRFGMLFQTAALFDSMSVGENVGLALREHRKCKNGEIDRIVAEKLALVGLPGIEAKRPADLSGGMRKRVGLARAIAMDPDYVLYDEPTTGLDPIMGNQIDVLIRSVQEQLHITSIIVTHDMKSAFFVGDRLCLIHEGRFRFDGTPEEMRESRDPIVKQFVEGAAEPEEESAGGGQTSRFRLAAK